MTPSSWCLFGNFTLGIIALLSNFGTEEHATDSKQRKVTTERANLFVKVSINLHRLETGYVNTGQSLTYLDCHSVRHAEKFLPVRQKLTADTPPRRSVK
tara:strand:+ start:418 stop:714 length:297 start_codon:yes stop_codon:yes gene_type:complete